MTVLRASNFAQVSQLRQMMDIVKGDYTCTAVAVHSSSKLQLREAGRTLEEAVAAAHSNRVGG